MPARKDQQVDASVVEKRGAAVRNQTMWWQCGFFPVHELNKPPTAILGSADGDPYRFRKFLAESYYQFNIRCKIVRIDISFDSVAKFIILLVSYTGSRQSEAVCRRLLHPYFTTESNDTGLRLYICHAVITAHGGTFPPKLI